MKLGISNKIFKHTFKKLNRILLIMRIYGPQGAFRNTYKLKYQSSDDYKIKNITNLSKMQG